MYFDINGDLAQVETFAVSHSIRDLRRLNKAYGQGRWRKRKGVALVRLLTGTIRRAELHSYEASGIGKREMKVKRFLD